ncbi:thymidylate kinase [Actinoplanes sp. SE50]|uniref:dTMP kinase n=1 Tax=unclassified Actinoplanes TaxID=2626549 RepID=UPI00023ECFE3|nr:MULTISPECIES: dTMP kinase [unclassified Actinoplanes]AEV82163.1 thymidylate kinase [Actinoplanes sp. SE50/110]ATO80562.1 thymidylate kinase [Actinoplanes sp. SE50]SLL97968.1 thymidylate kinase [Actinoplanes sp. SE50/110]
MTARPRTIALVGIDGSGKTTQARMLAAAMTRAGTPARYRQNAGGRARLGRLAVRLGREDAVGLLGRRGLLLMESVLRWLAIARTLLRRAVRREVTVMDRYAVCQYASVRAHRGTAAAERRARLAYRVFPRPDVTLFLAVDPGVARARIELRGRDSESLEYLTAADMAYRQLPEFAEFTVIDANGSPDQVFDAVQRALGRPAAPVQRPLRVRSLVLAGASAVTGAAVSAWQLAESFPA